MAIGSGAPSHERRALADQGLRIGTWNVRTLNDSSAAPRKLHDLASDARKYSLSILCVQETKFLRSGRLSLPGFHLYYSSSDRCYGGVGMLMSRAVHAGLIGVTNYSERLMAARFQLRSSKLHVLSAYAPTEAAASEDKDAFYLLLQAAIDKVPSRDTLVLVGDFNAQLGGESSKLWQGHLGKFVLPKDRVTDNGQRLLTSCVANGLVVRSTFSDIHLGSG